MDRKQIEDEHIVARYLADQLSPEEAAAFEAYYSRHPDMVREIELTLRLREGLATLRDRGQLDALVNARRRHWALPFSIAAAVLIGLLGFWAWRALPHGAPISAQPGDFVAESGAPIPLGGKFLLVRLRNDSAAVVRIPRPEERSAIELQVVPGQGASGSPYSLDISRDGRRVGSVLGLVPSDDGLLHAWLDSAQLPPGRYTVEVSAQGGDDAVDRFAIELQ